jgi:hypothetical protein
MEWNYYKISSSFIFRKYFSLYPGMRVKHQVLRHSSLETAQSCTQQHYRRTGATTYTTAYTIARKFALSRKALLGSPWPSVCRYVCKHYQRSPHWMYVFPWHLIVGTSRKSVEKIQIWLKPDKNIRQFIWRSKCLHSSGNNPYIAQQ